MEIAANLKRGGAEEARWAHNPEDGGSKPSPAKRSDNKTK